MKDLEAFGIKLPANSAGGALHINTDQYRNIVTSVMKSLRGTKGAKVKMILNN